MEGLIGISAIFTLCRPTTYYVVNLVKVSNHIASSWFELAEMNEILSFSHICIFLVKIVGKSIKKYRKLLIFKLSLLRYRYIEKNDILKVDIDTIPIIYRVVQKTAHFHA